MKEKWRKIDKNEEEKDEEKMFKIQIQNGQALGENWRKNRQKIQEKMTK